MYSSNHYFSNCDTDEIKFVICILNWYADVARPDKISGADINSICQEVRWMHIMYFLVFHRLVKCEVTVWFFLSCY